MLTSRNISIQIIQSLSFDKDFNQKHQIFFMITYIILCRSSTTKFPYKLLYQQNYPPTHNSIHTHMTSLAEPTNKKNVKTF
jgi:hypothetical protein